MTPHSAMLFAAGLGTRMRPLTDSRPKALIEVAGRPLIDHALKPAEEAGIPRRIVNLHWHAGALRAALAGRGVVFSDESDLLRETGGGLKHALPLIGAGPVFAMNTDAVWKGPNPYEVLADAWRDHMEGLVLLVPPERAVGHMLRTGFGIEAGDRAVWRPDYAYTGAQILRPEGLRDISQDVFSLRLLWDAMLARGTLYGAVYPGKWCDVGKPSSISLAEAMLETTP